MTAPIFKRDIVFEEVYKRRIEQSSQLQMSAMGNKIFLDGINFCGNIVIQMIAAGIEITPETITKEVHAALAKIGESVKVVEHAPIQEAPIVQPTKPMRFERIK